MTESYIQIQKQIEALQKKAQLLRLQEIDGVVGRIRVAIGHYGLTPEQLFGGTAKPNGTHQPTRSNASKRAARYGDGQGNTWSGMGKRPLWLRTAIEAGKKLEDFAIEGAPATRKQPARKARPGKARAARPTYRDQAGNVWSGMGPRPRWLREALAAGRTLEELTA